MRAFVGAGQWNLALAAGRLACSAPGGALTMTNKDEAAAARPNRTFFLGAVCILAACGGSDGEDSETEINYCDATLNPNLIGTLGIAGDCAGLLIVDNAMLKAAGSSSVGGDESFDFKPTDSYTLHSGVIFDFSQIYTGNVTDMSWVFAYTQSFNQNIRSWDVSRVTQMEMMFLSAEYFDQDLGLWDVSNVTDMSYMFHQTNTFDQDLSAWDVSAVTDMSFMFNDAAAFAHDLSAWNVCNVSVYEDFATDSPLELTTALHPDFGMACPDTTTAASTAILGQTAPSDPTASAAAIDQALYAGTMAALLEQNARAALNLDGIAVARDPTEEFVQDGRSTWVALGYGWADAGHVLTGQGTVAYALVGDLFHQRGTHAFGAAAGLEQGDWTYADDGDVTKTGVSAALYGGTALDAPDISEPLMLTGSLMITRFRNHHRDVAGAETTSDSGRVLVSGNVSRSLVSGTAGEAVRWRPYLAALYAHEDLGSYSFDGTTTYAATNAHVGEISLGAEFRQDLGNARGTLKLNGVVVRRLGTGTILLADGETLTPDTSVTGELSLGWAADQDGATQSSLSLELGGIGAEDGQDIRLNGTWDRLF